MISNHFADIILPLAVKGLFTYAVPDELCDKINPGSRVLVQFGSRKLYSGIVFRIHDKRPSGIRTKIVEKILDSHPLVNGIQLNFWHWISEYYMCSIGEVMKAALPSDLCLEGVTTLPLTEKYKPAFETYIGLASDFSESELNTILDKMVRATVQFKMLTVYLELSGYSGEGKPNKVKKSVLLNETGATPGVIDRLVRKKIFTLINQPTGRLKEYKKSTEPIKDLTGAQNEALDAIHDNLSTKNITLLHGVTSSGKTEIYFHLINEELKKGNQVLFLLPEISITAQIINRLNKHFGSVTGVYHSRINSAEKVEIWHRVAGKEHENSYRLIVGVRSALFLPFNRLGLVIVDEEHDGSYKQHDPAPRYHARDSAIMLANMHNAKTILGSASPSIESYYNAVKGKYGLVELKERYGLINLPGIILANLHEAYRKKLMVSHFTPQLLIAMDEALGNNEQIILFQNRRGFSPYIECPECGWIPRCIQCAVSLTYHKGIGKLVCHYCGFSISLPSHCESCHSSGLTSRGFGTEKIEDEIKLVFPSARVARMDQDTTRGKNSFNRLLKALDDRQIDILIGTQMISKGLDIENLTVVGVLNADNLLNYPDFRAHERSFQMMEQVSGRAGRRKKVGKVIIQTSDPDNKIIRLVLNHDYKNMFRMQADERKEFNYPPFCRLIKVSIRHKERSVLNILSDYLGRDLKKIFGNRILGPEYPLISRVQQWYIKTILIKLEREIPPAKAKKLIAESIERVEKEKGASSLKIAVDVDPY
jgi:primosomal protein N' (replication factor Y)